MAERISCRGAQVENHDVGPVLLVERDGFLAVPCLTDHFHVGLLVDHGRQPVANHRVIIGEHDADAVLQHGGHSGGSL